jgi:hypothetical protein
MPAPTKAKLVEALRRAQAVGDYEAVQDLTRRLDQMTLADGDKASRVATEQARQLIRAAYDPAPPSSGK